MVASANLRKNGFNLVADAEGIVGFMRRIAEGAADLTEIASWLREHSLSVDGHR